MDRGPVELTANVRVLEALSKAQCHSGLEMVFELEVIYRLRSKDGEKQIRLDPENARL